jgi:hypothetical protein
VLTLGAEGVNVELIEATTLPLTAERRSRIERYVAEWKRVLVQGDAVDEVLCRLRSVKRPTGIRPMF